MGLVVINPGKWLGRIEKVWPMVKVKVDGDGGEEALCHHQQHHQQQSWRLELILLLPWFASDNLTAGKMETIKVKSCLKIVTFVLSRLQSLILFQPSFLSNISSEKIEMIQKFNSSMVPLFAI